MSLNMISTDKLQSFIQDLSSSQKDQLLNLLNSQQDTQPQPQQEQNQEEQILDDQIIHPLQIHNSAFSTPDSNSYINTINSDITTTIPRTINNNDNIHTINTINTPNKNTNVDAILIRITTKLNNLNNFNNKLGLNINQNENDLNSFKFFLNQLNVNLNNYENYLINNEKILNDDFKKSLNAFNKIFNILNKFQLINDNNNNSITKNFNFENFLNSNSNKFKNIIKDFDDSNLKDLNYYINTDPNFKNYTLLDLNNELNLNLIKIRPIFIDIIIEFSKKILKFYDFLQKLNDYYSNDNNNDGNFLDNLPSIEDSKFYSNLNDTKDELKQIEIIKLILNSSKFIEINPILINKLNIEINNLRIELNKRIDNFNTIINNINDLKILLFDDENDDIMDFDNEFDEIKLNNDELNLIANQSIDNYSLDNLNNFKKIESKLAQIKEKRQLMLDYYVEECENYFKILSQKDLNNIEFNLIDFLKFNKNLKLKSFINFKNLLINLKFEKLKHLKEFIFQFRERIKNYWNILMYDENYCLNDFKEFYINDESKYDEDLLNLHSNYILKLRNEIDEIKPLLKLISNLNELKSDKKSLDLSIKDPSRLLKRNSFKILKNEEKLRNKLNKLLRLTINELRLKIKEFEFKYNRFFIINNENYSITLNNLEIELLGKNSHHNYHQNKKLKSIRGRSNERSIQTSRERSRSKSLPRKEILASSTRQNKPPIPIPRSRPISRSNSGTLSRSNSNLSSKNRSVSRKSINDPFDSKEVKDISPTKYNHSSSSNTSSSSDSSCCSSYINQQPRKITGSVLLSSNAHKINLEKLNTNDSLLLLPSSSSKINKKNIIIPEIPVISNFTIHQDTENNNLDINYSKPSSPSKLPIYKSYTATNNIITNTRSYLNRIPTSPVKFKDTVQHSNNDQVPEPISSDFECDDEDNDINGETLTLRDNKENYQPIINKSESVKFDNPTNSNNSLQNNSNLEIDTN